MKTKLVHWYKAVGETFWFIPGAIVLAALVLACLLIRVDASVDMSLMHQWPFFFGAGADGARGLLSAVATSMITVAGVVFSITIVALALTSSQYTSRVLGHFMRDRINQVVLGVFVGVFAYCIVVLRIIRGSGQSAFVPSIAVLVSLILSFVGIAFLIYFIHHVSMSIQASSIIGSVAQETFKTLDRLFPKTLKDLPENKRLAINLRSITWSEITARKTGYIEGIEYDALSTMAKKNKTIIRMARGIGEFVAEGAALIYIDTRPELARQLESKIQRAYFINARRTMHQDIGFGIRQLVDIALRALSPSVGDTTTAVMCVDYLGAILARIAQRELSLCAYQEYFITLGPSFEALLAEAFDQIRQDGKNNFALLLALLKALQTIADQTSDAERKHALMHHVELIANLARQAASSPNDHTSVDVILINFNESNKI